MIRAQVLKHLPGARESQKGETKEDVRGGATARGAMEKCGYIRVIEGDEVKTDGSIKYFFTTGVGSTFWVLNGVMAIEVPQKKEISGGGKDGGKKGVNFAIRRRRANMESLNIKE